MKKMLFALVFFTILPIFSSLNATEIPQELPQPTISLDEKTTAAVQSQAQTWVTDYCKSLDVTDQQLIATALYYAQATTYPDVALRIQGKNLLLAARQLRNTISNLKPYEEELRTASAILDSIDQIAPRREHNAKAWNSCLSLLEQRPAANQAFDRCRAELLAMEKAFIAQNEPAIRQLIEKALAELNNTAADRKLVEQTYQGLLQSASFLSPENSFERLDIILALAGKQESYGWITATSALPVFDLVALIQLVNAQLMALYYTALFTHLQSLAAENQLAVSVDENGIIPEEKRTLRLPMPNKLVAHSAH